MWLVLCQNLKVFTCTAPYPVDVFVRLSLRDRGWVEKFGPRLSLRDRGWVEKFGPRMICSATAADTTDKTLQCNTDEGNHIRLDLHPARELNQS